MHFRKMIVCLAVLAAGSAFAMDANQAEKAYEVRHSLFNLVGWNTGPLAGMAKKEIPFDAARAETHASRIAALVPMIPDAFAADTRGYDLPTEAKDAIWEEKEGFLQLAAAIRDKSAALETAAAGGDFDAFRTAFVEMGQACKDCHDRFRED
ncbi:c-type cytochrome [Lentisalinibacter sediminis]|uniref:c-type cytochrome n=1 Tax=Lentisalinibacter sediminis TaxID=2992237 RepID=UPI003863C58F